MKTLYNSIPFRNLTIDKQYRYTPTTKDNIECEGFVISTDKHGFVTQIADSHEILEVMNLAETKRFLCKSRHRQTINFILNFTHSIKSMFEHNFNLYTQLQHHKTIKFDDSQIKLHKHCLIITYHKHNWYFYDLEQYRDLKNIKTAKQTQKAAQETMIFINDIFFIPKRLYSLTHLIKDFALSCSNIPLYTDTPERIQEMYWHACTGGFIRNAIINTTTKTTTKQYEADIISAYPAQITELQSMNNGTWHNGILDHAKIGVVKCIVTPLITKNISISPLAVAEKSIIYITLNEYREYKNLYKIEVLDAYSFTFENHDRPFIKYIAKWWYVKQNNKYNAWQKALAKRMMNLLSGLFLHKLSNKNTNNYTIGQLFNPVYYATVTANTRIQVWRAIKDNLRDIIEIKTDSILSTKKLNLEYGTGLGEWCLK